MLCSLHIENIAVIERADISFDRGFNVLSGETGAGKSVIIDSLNAVLGERISRDIIRTGCEKATVSAVFSDFSPSVLQSLSELGFEPDEDGILLLERRLTADGKAAARVNGAPVTVAMLRTLGRKLVNIHGQHENQSLLDTATHLEYLDRLGGLEEMRAAYQSVYKEYHAVKAAMESLDMDETAKTRRMDLLRYQIEEIENAELTEGEEDVLRDKREMFRNAERIARAVGEAHAYLNGDDDTDGVLNGITQAVTALESAGRYMDEAATLAEKLEAIQYELDACADDVRRLGDALDFNESERDAVESRYEMIRRLLSKYGATTGDVLRYLSACRTEYEAMESGEAELARLTAEAEKVYAKLLSAAETLSLARQKAAKDFCRAVTDQMTFLDMSRARITVSMEGIEPCATGADKVEFLLAANVGEAPRPLAKIASGGEMSRVMLALQTVLADVDDMETLVFDEIDTGVSGRAALKVGRKLHETATGLSGTRRRQVLCVTHLAQIAAQANHHMLIEKAVKDGRTHTAVTALDESGRERELARIIGGEVTESGMAAARELRREYGQNNG